MSGWRWWGWVLAVLVALGVTAGCGKEAAPTAPQARLGPAIEEVFPPARATRVPVAVQPRVRFRAALDPATVVATNVFLKLDAQRLPIEVAYDAPTRTLVIRPQVALRLRRTYTVELSPRLATADGVPLDSTWFWQFTTTSLRLLEHPTPPSGTTHLTPFAPLAWDRTEPEAGAVRYDLYTGEDSAAVAARVTPASSSSLAYAWTPVPRPFGSTTWWTVRATNLETGEAIDGPVWRLSTLPAGTPVDSVMLQAVTYCSVRSTAPSTSNCSAASLALGGGTQNTAVRWSLAALPAGAQVAGARMILWSLSAAALTQGTAVYPTTTAFDGCSATFPGPPTRDLYYGVLARGVYDAASTQIHLTDVRLAAHLQAARTLGLPTGYSFTADAVYSIYSPASETRGPGLRVYVYRQPAIEP